MKKLYSLVVAMLVTIVAYAQPPVQPHDLSVGPYNMNAWPANSPAGTFPQSMILFAALKSANPTVTSNPIGFNAMAKPYSCIYNSTTNSRIVGLDDRGIQFVMTSTASPTINCPGPDTAAAYPYAANLVLNTLNCTNINVSYLNSVLVTGNGVPPRVTIMGLAWRFMPTDSFQTVPGVVPFTSALRSAGDSTVTSVTLPAALENKPAVELRWYFNVISSPAVGPLPAASGTRPTLRLDNINVTATVNGTKPRLSAFNFTLAPNPSFGSVKVMDSYAGTKTITIYTLQGAVITTQKMQEQSTTIDGLASGMYLVQVSHDADNTVATQKLVVK